MLTFEEFSSHITLEPNGCWVYKKHRISKYIRERNGITGKFFYAHRWAFEYFKGKIPDGLVIDHICMKTNCVNPDHLQAITNKENVLLGSGHAAINAAKRACKHGHEFNLENTYLRLDGGRRCRICKRKKETAN